MTPVIRNVMPFMPLAAVFFGLVWYEYRAHLPDFRLVIAAVVAAFALTSVLLRVLTGGWAVVAVGRHRRRLEALSAFAASLQDGRHDGRGFYGDGATVVSGLRRRRRVRLAVHRDEAALEAWVHHPVASWHLTRPALPDRLLRALRGREPRGGAADWRLGEHQGLAPGELERAQVERALRRLFQEHGVTQVALSDGVLRAQRPLREGDLCPERLDRAFDALETIAAMFDRREVVVRAVHGRSFALTTDGHGLRCPYCRDAIALDEPALAPCGACRTLHHVDCLDEAGGCTVMGCEGGPARPSERRRRVGA